MPNFANRTSAQLADKADVPGQRYTLRPSTKGSDFNVIADSDAGQPALETWSPGAAGTDATVYALNDKPWQQFDFVPTGGGAFRVISHFTGNGLTADGLAAGDSVSALPLDGSAAQEWLFSGPGQVVPPLAYDDNYNADPADLDAIVSGNVLANDIATSFDFFAFLASPPEHGEMVGLGQFIYDGITPWGAFDYQPDPGFTGIDIFGYRVINSGVASQIATVTVLVGDVRLANAADPTLSIEAPGSANRTALALGANGSLPGQLWRPRRSGDFFSFNLQSLLPSGQNKVIETWDPGDAGTVASLYRLNDLDWQRFDLLPTQDSGSVEIRSRFTGYLVAAAGDQVGDPVVAEPRIGGLAQQRWLVSPSGAEPAPFARADVYTAAANTFFEANVLANDDSNGFDLAAFVASQPEHGALVGLYQSLYGGVAPWGAFEYQPAPGFTGVDSFTYYARSSGDGTPSRLVTVTIRVE